jgi:hypothetical protein
VGKTKNGTEFILAQVWSQLSLSPALHPAFIRQIEEFSTLAKMTPRQIRHHQPKCDLRAFEERHGCRHDGQAQNHDLCERPDGQVNAEKDPRPGDVENKLNTPTQSAHPKALDISLLDAMVPSFHLSLLWAFSSPGYFVGHGTACVEKDAYLDYNTQTGMSPVLR